MDCLKRIKELLSRNNWTMYQLAQEAEIPQSTLSNLFIRNNAPTIPTLEKICAAFRISMSDFFNTEETEKSKYDEIISQWNMLSDAAKDAFLKLLSVYNEETR